MLAYLLNLCFSFQEIIRCVGDAYTFYHVIINQYVKDFLSSKLVMPVVQHKQNKWLTDMPILCCVYLRKSFFFQTQSQSQSQSRGVIVEVNFSEFWTNLLLCG